MPNVWKLNLVFLHTMALTPVPEWDSGVWVCCCWEKKTGRALDVRVLLGVQLGSHTAVGINGHGLVLKFSGVRQGWAAAVPCLRAGAAGTRLELCLLWDRRAARGEEESDLILHRLLRWYQALELTGERCSWALPKCLSPFLLCLRLECSPAEPRCAGWSLPPGHCQALLGRCSTALRKERNLSRSSMIGASLPCPAGPPLQLLWKG